MVDSRIQQSLCNDIQLQVKTQTEEYETINNNSTIIRPTDTANFTMRCLCVNESEVPTWSLPAGYTQADSVNCTHIGICIMNQTLSFLLLKEEYNGYYKCHVNSNSIWFKLFMFG